MSGAEIVSIASFKIKRSRGERREQQLPAGERKSTVSVEFIQQQRTFRLDIARRLLCLTWCVLFASVLSKERVDIRIAWCRKRDESDCQRIYLTHYFDESSSSGIVAGTTTTTAECLLQHQKFIFLCLLVERKRSMSIQLELHLCWECNDSQTQASDTFLVNREGFVLSYTFFLRWSQITASQQYVII